MKYIWFLDHVSCSSDIRRKNMLLLLLAVCLMPLTLKKMQAANQIASYPFFYISSIGPYFKILILFVQLRIGL